jgi:hypothetical protein
LGGSLLGSVRDAENGAIDVRVRNHIEDFDADLTAMRDVVLRRRRRGRALVKVGDEEIPHLFERFFDELVFIAEYRQLNTFAAERILQSLNVIILRRLVVPG